MEVSVKNQSGLEVRESGLKKLAEFVLEREDVKGAHEVSVALVDAEKMRELNLKYRHVDRPTDVLSFDLSDDGGLCGEIVISPEVALEQIAVDEVDEELVSLLIHGLLHLLGYTHDNDDDAEVMFDRHEQLKRAFSADGGTS